MITQLHKSRNLYISTWDVSIIIPLGFHHSGQNRYMMAAYLVIVQCDPKLIGYACSEEKFITKKKGFSGA